MTMEIKASAVSAENQSTNIEFDAAKMAQEETAVNAELNEWVAEMVAAMKAELAETEAALKKLEAEIAVNGVTVKRIAKKAEYEAEISEMKRNLENYVEVDGAASEISTTNKMYFIEVYGNEFGNGENEAEFIGQEEYASLLEAYDAAKDIPKMYSGLNFSRLEIVDSEDMNRVYYKHGLFGGKILEFELQELIDERNNANIAAENAIEEIDENAVSTEIESAAKVKALEVGVKATATAFGTHTAFVIASALVNAQSEYAKKMSAIATAKETCDAKVKKLSSEVFTMKAEIEKARHELEYIECEIKKVETALASAEGKQKEFGESVLKNYSEMKAEVEKKLEQKQLELMKLNKALEIAEVEKELALHKEEIARAELESAASVEVAKNFEVNYLIGEENRKAYFGKYQEAKTFLQNVRDNNKEYCIGNISKDRALLWTVRFDGKDFGSGYSEKDIETESAANDNLFVVKVSLENGEIEEYEVPSLHWACNSMRGAREYYKANYEVEIIGDKTGRIYYKVDSAGKVVVDEIDWAEYANAEMIHSIGEYAVDVDAAAEVEIENARKIVGDIQNKRDICVADVFANLDTFTIKLVCGIGGEKLPDYWDADVMNLTADKVAGLFYRANHVLEKKVGGKGYCKRATGKFDIVFSVTVGRNTYPIKIAEYDSEEQTKKAIIALADSVKRGDKQFIFPTAEELKAAAEVEEQPTMIDKLKAKVAEQKKRLKKSVIDWAGTLKDYAKKDFYILQNDLKRFIELGEIELAAKTFETIKEKYRTLYAA